ncbi:hypothetical protein GJ496_006348, partial [Pomphorhynchus laevis]
MSLTPKLDVLKRYKSNPKRKKNHHKNKDSCGKLKVVVDSDVYLPTNNNSNFDISDIEEDIDEDAPVIAEIIDERPEHFKATDDLFEKSKWRAIEKPRGMQDPVKFHLNPKSVKLNVGDRLSSNRLKAAKKASEYAKLLTASQSVNESSNKSNVNTQQISKAFGILPLPLTNKSHFSEDKNQNYKNNWRNIEVIPDSSISIFNPNESLAKASVVKPENEDDNDSDLSPDRPTESARADLRSRRTTGDTTIRRDQQQQDNIQKEELKLERENQYKIWSKGIVQLNNYEQQNKLLDTSKEELFTRHKDDKELDEFLKSQERQ